MRATSGTGGQPLEGASRRAPPPSLARAGSCAQSTSSRGRGKRGHADERSWCHALSMGGQPGRDRPRAFHRFRNMPPVASGRAVILSMLVLVVCDVIGGFIGVASGVNTWDEAWGFNTESTVPLPVGAAQLALAWLAARNVRPPVGLIAAVLLSAFCLISLIFGLFDGDLINNVASAGLISWGVVWGVVLLSVTAAVGLLAAFRARQLYRLR